MGRDIRLHYEHVAGVAVVLAVLLPLYFLLTGFAVLGSHDSPLRCASTITELGRDRPTTADPTEACHGGAVDRLHVAVGYLAALLAVALTVLVVGEIRERRLNGAWERGRAPSQLLTTPGQVWIFAGLLFVVFIAVARNGI